MPQNILNTMRDAWGRLRRWVCAAPSELIGASALGLAPLTLRFASIIRQGSAFARADAQGCVSDVTVSAVLAVGFVTCARRLGRKQRLWAAGVAAFLWTTLHVGNYEHIAALGAPLQLTYAQYMRDGVFLTGSALSVSSLALSVALLAGVAAGLVLAVRAEMRVSSWQLQAILVLALAFGSSIWPRDPLSLAWRDSHFMALWLRPSNASASAVDGRAPLPDDFRANVREDVNGKMIVAQGKNRPNVLLVMIEGISGANIPSIAAAHGIRQAADMPELSAIAEKSITFPTFIANQRQTNRGEYALLCGRLDYLVSGTSRMTEYAREGGEPCLPHVLAQNGYRTMYIQPAPLSFMMKDQFMVRAGFSDVRGHDHFTKAYARSSWGVDDKAFFEQAAVTLEELDRAGSPWFAALLTVGTHHPYTVPAKFRTGTSLDKDHRALAIRYLDQAVSAFVHQLEASRLLEDTLLLITSDESFGVDNYDDVTKLLSYNWGFLIARVPGEAAKVVSSPHAQTDVALTITDYLGLGSAHFTGRSLFREYGDKRSIVFANTYQQKVYSTSGLDIVECDEALTTCQKHSSQGSGLFSPERTTVSAVEKNISPLRQMLAVTSHPEKRAAGGRTPLILDNAAVWEVGPKSQGVVFGGQYFSMAADQEIVVAIDATVVGRDAALVLDSDIFSAGMLYEVLPPLLYDGDSVRFEYVLAPGRDLGNVEVRLNPRQRGSATSNLIMRNAEMIVRARTLERPGGVTTSFRLERGRPMQAYFIGSGISAEGAGTSFAMKDCVALKDHRQLVATNCSNGYLLFGPYVKVPAGRSVRATFEVASERGTARFSGDIVTGAGKMVLAKGDEVEVPAESWVREGFSRTITMNARTNSDVDALEARLALVSADADASLIIRRAILEVLPLQ